MIYIIIIVILLSIVITLATSLLRKTRHSNTVFNSIHELQKKRYELIPSIIQIIKPSIGEDDAYIQSVNHWRHQATARHSNINQKVTAENELSKAMEDLFQTAYAYPAVRTDKDFIELNSQWNNTNNEIEEAQKAYNNVVGAYNVALQSFPTNIIAKVFKYKPKKQFEINQAA